MFRPATASDVEAILAAPHEPVSPLDPVRAREDFALRRHRPEWSWVAEQDGRITASVLWWGLAESSQPTALTQLWAAPGPADPAGLAGALLVAATAGLRAGGLTTTPEVELDLPVDRQHDDAVRAAVAWRRAACARIGVTEWNERRQQEWTDDRPVPAPSGRLAFGPGTDEAFLAVFRAVAVGSLDVLTVRTLAELGPEGQAQDDLDFYRSLPGDRALWRLASDRSGAVVGFAIPSRSAYEASVSCLGVVPEHRGNAYVDDLLAEITRVHAAAGAARITGTTDSTNVPMLGAFARAGYTVTGIRIVGSAPATG